jgi:hypothetical protein
MTQRVEIGSAILIRGALDLTPDPARSPGSACLRPGLLPGVFRRQVTTTGVMWEPVRPLLSSYQSR